MKKAIIFVFFAALGMVTSSTQAGEAAPQITLSIPGIPRPTDTGNFLALDTTPWDRFFDRNDNQIVFGVKILGPSPYTRNIGTFFKPASTSKLFTASSALSHLGPDFRFKTTLQWNPTADPGVITGLTLIGGGDPTWGLDDFGETLKTRVEQFAAELKRRGVTEIRGPIQVRPDDPRWSQLRFPEGWELEDHFNCGGSLAQAFNLQGNCATFVIKNTREGSWSEYGISTPVSVNLKYGAATDLQFSETADGYEILGTLKKAKQTVSVNLPIKNTEAWVKNLFLRSLGENGIALHEDLGAAAQIATETFVYESPTLAQIFQPFLKNSFNFLGDAIFKIVGRQFGPQDLDLVAASQAALREFVGEIGASTALAYGAAPIQGFFSDQVTLWDGSGLSRESQVTSTALVTLLEDIKHRPTFNVLWNALPIAGVDGTLRTRMRSTAAEGILRAKTGTLRGVYNLSGYVPHFGKNHGIDDYIPFVILTETTLDQKDAARAAEDRVGAALAKAINP